CRKRVRQGILKTDMAYKCENASIAVMLDKWLEEEIKYMEVTKQLKLSLNPEIRKAGEGSINKIFINISVAEMACLLKVLTDAKVIKIDNYRDLFRTISRVYRTPNSENVSEQSLRSKFYKSEISTKTSVKDLLIRLLNQINSSHN